MSIRPAHVREHLFPRYYGAIVDQGNTPADLGLQIKEEFSEDEEEEEESNPEDRQNLQRSVTYASIQSHSSHSTFNILHGAIQFEQLVSCTSLC